MNVASTTPSGYVLCNGADYPTTGIYTNLYNLIGTSFGSSGSNFKVPNYQGMFLRGMDSQTLGGVTYQSGATPSTFQEDSVLQATVTAQGYWTVNVDSEFEEPVRARNQITGDPVDTNTGIFVNFTRQNTTENRVANFGVYYFIKL